MIVAKTFIQDKFYRIHFMLEKLADMYTYEQTITNLQKNIGSSKRKEIVRIHEIIAIKLNKNWR